MALGLSWFSRDRSATRSGAGLAGINGNVDSGSNNFFIPEFGYNWKSAPTCRVGVTVYGNGGMNTDYPGGQIPRRALRRLQPGQAYNMLCGSGKLGVDLMQLMVAPYVSWQFTQRHSVGVALLLAYQRFKAEGLQAFDNPVLSTGARATSPTTATATPGAWACAWATSASSPTCLGRRGLRDQDEHGQFDEYKGLFAERRLRHSVELHGRRPRSGRPSSGWSRSTSSASTTATRRRWATRAH